MPFDQLPIIEAVKIVREVGTIGSSPLVVMDRDGNQYFAKTTTSISPRVELINEVFCALALQCWEILVPQIALVQIPYELVERYNLENPVPISDRYLPAQFEVPFFASTHVGETADLGDFMPGLSKPQFNKLLRPKDLIKIGVFDLWVGNKDRRPENPNFLMVPTEGKFNLFAIDHTAAFAHLPSYQAVREALLHMERKFSILATPMAKDILKYLEPAEINTLKNELLSNIDTFNAKYEDLVSTVPADWGFSKKAKAHLKEFFKNAERNSKIISSFINY